MTGHTPILAGSRTRWVMLMVAGQLPDTIFVCLIFEKPRLDKSSWQKKTLIWFPVFNFLFEN